MAHEQPLPAVVLARDFFTLQEERVRQYAALSASHREYLSTAPSYDIETYQRAVADATRNFKEISERIIEMRTQFDEEFREKVQALDKHASITRIQFRTYFRSSPILSPKSNSWKSRSSG